jgi:hypothetical protein
MPQNSDVTYFAHGQVGYQEQIIGIAPADRRFHFYAIGRTGTGKSTLLFAKIVQDLRAGRGLALIDPHGDLAEAVLPYIPPKRKHALVYLNPADLDFPLGLNMLQQRKGTERHLLADHLMTIFHKIWADSWGPRMSYLLHNSLLALLENPGSTLLSVARLLSDDKFRRRITRHISDPVVRHYWEKEFASIPPRLLPEVVSPVQNKIGAYLSNRPLRNILGQSKSTIKFEQILDQGQIFIVNLAKGRLGSEAANLLGSFLVTGLQLAAMARADIPESERRDFYLYVDEFQNFTTESFADILSEARKYRLNLILAHQYLGQLDRTIREAVLANVGTLVVFRVGPEDAQLLAKEFGAEWPYANLVNLNPHEIYYKLMRDGKVEDPRLARTLAPPDRSEDEEAYRQELIAISRRNYGRPRAEVERRIEHFFGQQKEVRIGLKK